MLFDRLAFLRSLVRGRAAIFRSLVRGRAAIFRSHARGRASTLGPASLVMCAVCGFAGGPSAAQAQGLPPSSAGQPPSAAPAAPPAPPPASETIEPLPGSAPASPASQQSPPPGGDPAGQASVYAAPYGSGQAQPPYYGTYAPTSDYPSAPSYAGPLGRAPGPGSHEHEGFFLRLTLGVGAASNSYKERIEGPQVSEVQTRGLAVTFELAVGGRVVDNFIVHGNLSFAGADSNREIDGVQDRSYRSLGTSMWLFGAGGTYYFMPTNLYLTLVLGTGGFVETRDYGSLETDQEQIESRVGFASSLAVGKEWWVGGRGEWGIGGSITASVYAVPLTIDDVQSTAVGNVISLNFSSTLN